MNLYKVKIMEKIGGSSMSQVLSEPLVLADSMDEASFLAEGFCRANKKGAIGISVKSVTLVATPDPSGHNPLVMKD